MEAARSGAFERQYTLGEPPLLHARVAMASYAQAVAIQRQPDWRARARAALADDPLCAAAIWCAAPDFYQLALQAGDEPGVAFSIMKYLIRMAARTTPFGLFAAVAAVETGARTTLELDESALRLHAEPDAAWVRSFIDTAARKAGRTPRVLVNDLVIRRGDRLLVFAPQGEDGAIAASEFVPAVVRDTAAVAFVRREYREGDVREMADGLATEFGLEAADASAFLAQLAQTALIYPKPPPVFAPGTLRALRAEPALASSDRAAIDGLQAQLDAIERGPVGSLRAERLERARTQFVAAVDEPPKHILKIDLAGTFGGTLNRRVLADVARLADAHLRLADTLVMREYAAKFVRRYEGRDRLVPLIELVSHDFGIGPAPREADFERRDYSAFRMLIMRRGAEALREGRLQVDLEPHELDRVLPELGSAEHLPDSFELSFEIGARDRAAIDRGDYLVYPGLMRTSLAGYQSVARFAHMLPPRFAERAASSLPRRDDAVDAELVYVPTPLRYANVAVRPRLHPYRIEIGCRTGQPRLAPERLFVGLDQSGFFLYSDELGKRVQVHETHRLNPNHANPVARLLSFLAYEQRLRVGGLDGLLGSFGPFLPRLVVDRAVLARARWLFDRPTEKTDARTVDALCASLARLGAPLNELNAFSSSDQALPCDLTTEAGRELLLDLIEHSAADRPIFLEESPAADDMWLDTARGKVRTEFVATYVRGGVREARPPASIPPGALSARPATAFAPGSDWQFLKLFCGTHFFDVVLRDELAPFVADLSREGLLEQWFFIRYEEDGGSHLRVRFKPAPARRDAVDGALRAWIGTLMQGGLCTRIALDTYLPEYERYGGTGAMAATEALFTASSNAVLAVLARCMHDPAERIVLGVATLARICAPFDAPLSALLDAGTIPRKLPASLRAHVGRVATMLAAQTASGPPPTVAAAADTLRELARQARLERAPGDILAALAHVHFNRMGISPEQEPPALALLRAARISANARARA